MQMRHRQQGGPEYSYLQQDQGGRFQEDSRSAQNQAMGRDRSSSGHERDRSRDGRGGSDTRYNSRQGGPYEQRSRHDSGQQRSIFDSRAERPEQRSASQDPYGRGRDPYVDSGSREQQGRMDQGGSASKLAGLLDYFAEPSDPRRDSGGPAAPPEPNELKEVLGKYAGSMSSTEKMQVAMQLMMGKDLAEVLLERQTMYVSSAVGHMFFQLCIPVSDS